MNMKVRGRTDILLILCGLLVWFLADADRIRSAAAQALDLCARSVIPAMFPFMVVSGLLVSLGFGAWISPHLAGCMTPLFRLPGCASSALLLGLVGGYPIGAQTAAGLYRDRLLTREEAQRLLTFCNNANPVFLISVLGAGVFGSVRVGVWLWLIHVASALLTGLVFRKSRHSTARQYVLRSFPCQTISLAGAFAEAMRTALNGTLAVCASVVLFYVLATPFRALGGLAGAALTGTVELFSLVPLLTPNRAGFILAAACAGWGGFSVLFQTIAVLEGSGLHPVSCLKGKLVQSLFSGLLAAAVSFLL